MIHIQHHSISSKDIKKVEQQSTFTTVTICIHLVIYNFSRLYKWDGRIHLFNLISSTSTSTTNSAGLPGLDGHSRWAYSLSFETRLSDSGTMSLYPHARLTQHQSSNSGIDSTHLQTHALLLIHNLPLPPPPLALNRVMITGLSQLPGTSMPPHPPPKPASLLSSPTSRTWQHQLISSSSKRCPVLLYQHCWKRPGFARTGTQAKQTQPSGENSPLQA